MIFTIEMQRSHKEMNCHSQKLQCYMYNLNTLLHYSNLQSSLLRCGTRSNEWGAQ